MRRLLEEIQLDEGFSEKPYIDVLVARDPEAAGIPKNEFEIIKKHFDKLKVTFGYGSTFITKKGAEATLEEVMDSKISRILEAKPIIHRLPTEKQEVIFSMVYQIGVTGVLKFKKMWAALENFDYEEAAKEGRDSLWYRQTPNRAEKLMRILES